ncbi:MAG TPA: glycine/sarcosine/betaine reductase component B subunit [Chloroflexota bacterium]|nr:glycine/sarcosine/betaine reductase component B subunit [Chloroflexota bacterium]
MRLTWRVHRISGLRWGEATRIEAGTLHIEREALTADLLQDQRLSGVDLQLVAGGESCRILPVFDIVEPRAKIEPAGADFPGVLTPVRAVGMGATRVLRGMAVEILDPSPPPNRVPILDLTATPLDGWSAAEQCRYASLQHLVVVPRLQAGLDVNERCQALRLANLRAATFLARNIDAEPDEEQSFELTAVDESLRRVAYVYQMHSHQRPTVPGEGLLYGDNCRHLLPTIVHPNEVIDGAVLRAYDGLAIQTYGIQNHAVILDLYRRHGHDLNFAGVVVNVANQLPEERDRATVMTGNLVKYALKADGAVFSKSGGGAPHVDMALAAARCEELGVKTSMLAWDLTSSDDGLQGATLFSSPLLNAIVSVGSNNVDLPMPPVERVIAPTPDMAERYQGQIVVQALRGVGMMDQLGSSRFTATFY